LKDLPNFLSCELVQVIWEKFVHHPFSKHVSQDVTLGALPLLFIISFFSHNTEKTFTMTVMKIFRKLMAFAQQKKINKNNKI